MSWFKKYLTAARMMSIGDALRILDIPIETVRGKSADEVSLIVKKQRNRLALITHPDKAINPEQKIEFEKKMKDINNAFDALKASGFNISGSSSSVSGDPFSDIWDIMDRMRRDQERRRRSRGRDTGPGPRPGPRSPYGEGKDVNWEDFEERMRRNVSTSPPPRPVNEPSANKTKEDKQREWDRREKEAKDSGRVPPWAVEWDAPHFNIGNDRSDARYCQKEVYENSIKAGEVETFFIWEFAEVENSLRGTDGKFTNLLRVNTNWSSIFRAIKIAEDYFRANSHGRRDVDKSITPSILVEPSEYNRANQQRDELYLVQVGNQSVNMRFSIGSGGERELINQISQAIRKFKGTG